MIRRPAQRTGFAMLSVLWAVVVVGTLVVAVSLAGRDAFDAGRNRVNATRAFWHANDCAERARLVIDDALSRADQLPPRTWRKLDGVVLSSPASVGSDCEVRLEATGTRLDVNSATTDELVRLFTAVGRADADAVADAIDDWRDSDDDPRMNGAEASWYAAQRRPLPRNGPIADDEELSRIRGLEDGAALRVLSVEVGPISIATALPPVLLAVPGFTDEAVAAVVAARARGEQIDDLLAFVSSLSSAARDSLVSNYQEISRRTTLDPEAWILTASGWSGHPAVFSHVELRLVRTNRRAVVVRRRVRS
jgi:general secretion pathway protein K